MAKRFNGEGSIRQRSNGSWEARYTNPLLDKQQSVYGKTKQEVQKKLKEKLRELDELVEEKEKQQGKLNGKNLTLNEWNDTYMKRYKKDKIKPQTYSSYYSQYNNWIEADLGDTYLTDITYGKIIDILNKANNRNLAKGSIKSLSIILSSCLDKAVKEKLIKENPAHETYDDIMGREFKEKRALTNEEINWFFRGLSERDPNYKFLFQLMLSTGLRVNELTALRWKNVSSDFKFILVEATTTFYYDVEKQEYVKELCLPKTRHVRKVPIMDELQSLFKQHKERLTEQWNLKLDETDFVFQYKLKKQITYGRIKTIMNHVNSYLYTEYNVNLDEFTTHYFRHTFGTLAIHSNMSLVDIQKIGGWANPQTLLKVYAHTNDEMMSNEINKLDISLG